MTMIPTTRVQASIEHRAPASIEHRVQASIEHRAQASIEHRAQASIEHRVQASIEQSETFWDAAFDDAREASLSIDRCIDWLLDLYQATEHQVLRELVADVLDDLRAVGADGLGFAELDLDDVVLGALASVETAFELFR